MMNVGVAAGEQALDRLAHAGNAGDDDSSDPEHDGQTQHDYLTGFRASPSGLLEVG